jgi:SpoVK/Ycf46/Vps4 family AAA+-type ATPase
MAWDKLASETVVEKVSAALKSNGIETTVLNNGADALKKINELIPQGTEIVDMASATLDKIGFREDIASGRYTSFRQHLFAAPDSEERTRLRRMSLAPKYTIGSVQAITEEGELFMVSATGSQLPAYAFGAEHVIFVVGTQKLVKNMDEAMKRLYEYVVPLEEEAMQKKYKSHTSVNKILVIKKEVFPNRIKVLLVKENIGF